MHVAVEPLCMLATMAGAHCAPGICMHLFRGNFLTSLELPQPIRVQ